MNRQILEVLVSSSVLILALALLRVFLRGRISARLQYGLWLLAALRLLIPVSFGSSAASVMNYVPERQMSEILADASVPAQLPQTAAALAVQMPSAMTDEPALAETPEAAQRPAASDSENQNARFQPAPLTICYFIWGIGAVVAWTVMVGQNAALAARLRRSRVRLDVPECQIPVYITEMLPSACLFGLFHPAIYLTPQSVGEDAVPNEYVLLHEMTHYRRRDHVWCALRLLLLAAYWFDPFVWLAGRLSKTDCELACDEAALKGLDDGARFAYGRTLLDQISGRQSVMQHALCATMMSAGKRTLRARIRRIAKRQKTTAASVALVIGAVCLLAACTFTNSAERAGQEGGDLPAMVQVDGTLYVMDIFSVSASDAARVEKTGEVKSYVAYSRTPGEDDQANFPDIGREYGMLDGQLVVKDSQGQWKYTIMQLPNAEVEAAVERFAPGTDAAAAMEPCRMGTLYAAARTNADESVDILLYLVGKADGEIRVTHAAEGRFSDADGYGIYQARFDNQTVVFGLLNPQGMRETETGTVTSVDYGGVTVHFENGSQSQTMLPADPAPFLVETYDMGEAVSVHLGLDTLAENGDTAIFTDIPTAGEDRQAVMTLAGNFTEATAEETSEPALSEEEIQSIRQEVFDKLGTAQWDWDSLTEDEIRTFAGTDSRENGMAGNYPNYYGVFADYFVSTGRAPGENQTWKLSLPEKQILALTIEEGGEVFQKLYYSLDAGTLCGLYRQPLLEADSTIGVGVSTDYADEDLLVFHGYFGLFVYDLKESKIAFAMDLSAATGTTNMQGSCCNFVTVWKDTDTVKIMAGAYNDMQGGIAPVCYDYDTKSGELRFVPTAYPEGGLAVEGAPAHAVGMSDSIGNLIYSDGEKTWKLFENWNFGGRSNAVFVPLTNDAADKLPGAPQAEQKISGDEFYEMFWEVDRDSMQTYLDEHPEALQNGWAGIDINESGLEQSGTAEP